MIVNVRKEVSMYERSLNEAERILATHKDVVAPVKEIWLEVSKQGQLQRFEVPPIADFTALLEGDDRFEFIPAGEELGDEYVEPMEDDELEYTTDMQRLGFYSEDRVRLSNIEVSEELTEELSEDASEPVAAEEEIEEESPKKSPSAVSLKLKKSVSPNNQKQKTAKSLKSPSEKMKKARTAARDGTKTKKKRKSK